MARILFVDDAFGTLAEVRDVVTEYRANWTVGWTTDGLDALEHLVDTGDVDVVVVAVGVPEAAAGLLLEQVRRRFPAAARVVVTGHANRDAVIAVGGVAQQFVAKPCSPTTLIGTVDSLLAARHLVHDIHLQSLLGGQEALPKPPAIYAELTALTSRPEATVTEIARLIERDLATTTELLHLVNCSFFGLANEITSVVRAVTLLGLDVIQALVLAGRAFRPSRELPPGLNAAEVAAQGLRACLALRDTEAARGLPEARLRQLGVGALLRDVALLSLAAHRPESWAQYARFRTLCPETEAQERAFGCTVARASAYLLALWGFHSVTVNALAGHVVDLEDDFSRVEASRSTLAIAQAHEIATGMVAGTGSTP